MQSNAARGVPYNLTVSDNDSLRVNEAEGDAKGVKCTFIMISFVATD